MHPETPDSMGIREHRGTVALTRIQLPRISAEATKRPVIEDPAFRTGANQGVYLLAVLSPGAAGLPDAHLLKPDPRAQVVAALTRLHVLAHSALQKKKNGLRQ